MKKFLKAALFLVLLMVFSQVLSFAGGNTETPAPKTESAVSFLSNIDNSTSPGEDFFQYANGTWLKNNPIPDEYSRWMTFIILDLQVTEKLHDIMEKAAQNGNADTSSMEYKIGAFYATGMDEKKIEKDGINPLKGELAKIDSIKNLEDLTAVIAHMHRYTAIPLFDLGASPDYENSDFMILKIYQGGLGLPERDYYVNKDKASQETREKYVKHIANVFVLAGFKEDESKTFAKKIMDIETSLAIASKTNVELRDSKANNNKISFNQLKKIAPNFNWDIYFKDAGMNYDLKINVGQPEFIKAMSKALALYPLEDWKMYLKWNLINNNANYLSSDFVNEHFDFYNKYLSGAKVIQPRWKRVVKQTSNSLDEAVGEIFVNKYFPPEAKKRMLIMVNNLINTYGERIKNLDWMSKKTKQQALKKLNKIKIKIGYPDKWKDFSALVVKNDSYFANQMRVSNFWFNREIKKIGKPVDKTEWDMPPQTVNAFYSAQRNEIIFPAGILQPPFFDFNADDAVNYGAIGAIIGHEITHGFDDKGRNYDSDGNLKDWWTKQDEQNFIARSKLIVNEYSACIPIDDMHINGELTLGENIADLGGVTIALQALLMTPGFNANNKIEGFTPIQRFFLSWANVWRGNIRPAALKLALKTDVHSPGKYRTNIPLSNIQEFLEVFNIKSGDKMYRTEKDRAKIW